VSCVKKIKKDTITSESFCSILAF